MLIIHDIIIDVTDNFFKHATMQSNHVYKGNGLLKIYEKHKNKITMILTYQFLQKQDTKQNKLTLCVILLPSIGFH